MPNRMFRDWTGSKKMARLSSCGERFFTRLMMRADDFGNYQANPKFLNGNLFPEFEDIRDIDIAKWIDECVAVGVICRYTVDEKKYIHIYNFNQRLDRRSAKFPREHEDPNFHHVDTCQPDANQMPTNGCPEVEVEVEDEIEVEKEKPLRAGGKKIIVDNLFPVGTAEYNAWEEWLQYRKEIKKKLSPSTARKQMKFLGGRAGPEIVEIINQSIMNGWTGLFELKHNGTKNIRTTTKGTIRRADASVEAPTDYGNF